MLVEWFKHLTTPCPAPYKAMGYLKELISMGVRQKRCREAWAPHFRECRDLIDKATEGIGHHKVTVLGSGLLLDFSLDLLADTFDKVVLVDILHLPVVQKRVRAFANVELFTNDHTGVAEATWDHVQQGRTGALPSAPPSHLADTGPCGDSDLVVSANLLTQLPLMPLGLLLEKAPTYPEDEAKAFARRIVEDHLHFLSALPSRVCLLTETQRVIFGGPKGDEMIEEIDPLFGVSIPASGRKWVWNIAPRPEINPHIDLRYRMTGIIDLKAATE
ncbi:MAG TPA: hypothetical protein EYM29_06635 [Rhodospirillales bacterium]|nr:hypothetical protein [Rhodospirillales bacterium]